MNENNLLDWAAELLGDIVARDPFNDCDCEPCAECGALPDVCSVTACAASCSCGPCDGCRVRAWRAAYAALAGAGRQTTGGTHGET